MARNPYSENKRLNEQLAKSNELYLSTNHKLVHTRKKLKALEKAYLTQFPPGHFYSPYPNLAEMAKRHDVIFSQSKRPIAGIDMREKQQLELLEKLAAHYPQLPYLSKKKQDLRYYFANSAYSYTDAIMLYSMLRHYQPKKVIEIGSGYSSALMLDTNDLFLESKTALTFIEPYPELLLSLLHKQDKYELIASDLSAVEDNVFKNLGKGDILFIDSTHVSKAGSDVNQIFFEILPLLKKGVIIHIHDIFYPFEYPYEWIKEGRAWNEDYLVRAFLHNNHEYRILLFNHFLNTFHGKTLSKLLPATAKNSGGSLWLEKV